MALEMVFCKTFASPRAAELSGLSGLLNFFEKTVHQMTLKSRKCWSLMVCILLHTDMYST